MKIKNWFLNTFNRILKRNDPTVNDSPHILNIPIDAPYFIEVIGYLPYYVPVPENVILKPSLIGAEPFFLEFIHFSPLRHPDDSRGKNVDDRLGTFIRSKSRVLFPLSNEPETNFNETYEDKSLEITNRALESIRYVAFDHTVMRIEQFDKAITRAWKIHDNGEAEIFGQFTERSNYGPYGLTLLRTLKNGALEQLWYFFNDITPKNASWLLVLDAKHHNTFGDISRAILDLCTALEIHIPRMIELRSTIEPRLMQIDVDGVSIFTLYDSILDEATGHSLHEKPDLFVKLEYIRAVRNSIAHSWKPEFRITRHMERNSRYLDIHREYDGHIVSSKEEVEKLIEVAIEIIKYTEKLFSEAIPLG